MSFFDRARKIFCLPVLPAILLVLSAAALLVCVFSEAIRGPVIYAVYLYSTYALCVGVCGLIRLLRFLRSGFRATPFGARLTGDVFFRSQVSLFRGVAVNLAYVLIKLVSGVRYRSTWFLALAVYYAVLTVLRYFLLTQLRAGPDFRSELRRCRLCGILLMLMNLVLSGIVILIVYQNQGYEYPGFLIYAMAAYTFYAVIIAIVQLARYRKHGSPVLTAAKVVSLTAALVSMLSLETAMISQFGDNTTNFRFIVTGFSGTAVCAIVLAMASYMIVKPTRELQREERS